MSIQQSLPTAVADADLTGIQARLRRFVAAAHANSVILLEMSGHLICAAGPAMKAGESVALGALLAGVFSSAREMATMLGETDFRALLQQGATASIYTLRIADDWLLVTVFDQQTHVGMVRMLAEQEADALAVALLGLRNVDLADVRELVHSAAFQHSFDATIDQLFRDIPTPQREDI